MSSGHGTPWTRSHGIVTDLLPLNMKFGLSAVGPPGTTTRPSPYLASMLAAEMSRFSLNPDFSVPTRSKVTATKAQSSPRTGHLK